MSATLYRHRFGSVEFDESRSQLRIEGSAVELQQKPLELLALLLSRPGELLPKASIFEQLWKGRAVVDGVLANAASKLRAALGPANAAFVVTVPRLGYRFEGEVQRIAVGRGPVSALALAAGMPVPGRAGHRLVRQLGASTRNETWLAQQPRTGDRRVYKFALDGERLADLKRELTLARVLHGALGERPDLMRVLDNNFDQAPFWIECEYGGENLEAWAATLECGVARLTGLSRAARLDLALQMADALAAAHGAAVLHKDLKPANILVRAVAPPGRHDTAAGGAVSWRIRLADFGSGRLLDPAQLERLRVTRLGLTLEGDDPASGTPYYIAPELLTGGVPGPASDVYALGVVLFQLLAGDLRRPLAPGWEREIDDALLREDIALATDIDPQRRLTSAAALAVRLRRLDERHAEREAERSRSELEAQRLAIEALARRNEAAMALNRLLREDLIGAANLARQGRADITVAEALTGAAERIDVRYADLSPAVRGSLHAAMQAALAELSRAQEAVEAGRRAVAALDEAERSAPSAEASEALDALQQARLRLALDLVQLSRLDEARGVMAALETAAARSDHVSAHFQARRLYVKSWLTGGELANEQSLGLLEQAHALLQHLDEERAPGHDMIVFALADTLAMLGRHAEAESHYRRLHRAQSARFGADHHRTCYTLVGLGSVLARLRRYDEAKSTLTQAAEGLAARLGLQHRQTLTALDMLADLRFRQGDDDGAAAVWLQVQTGFATLLGPGSSYTLTVQTQRARALHRAGRLEAAEPLLREALERAAVFLGDDEPQRQQIRYALADCLLDLGRAADAAILLEGLQPSTLNTAQPEPDWAERLAHARARTTARRPAGPGFG